MKSKTALRTANFIAIFVSAIAFICFSAATVWGNTNFSPSANQNIYSKIKRLNEVVEAFLQKGQLDQAGKFVKKTKEIAENHLSPYDPELAVALDHLANYHWAREEFSTAAPFYLQALKIKERNLGPHHPRLEPTLERLLEFHTSQKEFDETLPFLLKLIKIKENKLGPYQTHFEGYFGHNLLSSSCDHFVT